MLYWVRIIIGGALGALGGAIVLCNLYLCARSLRGNPSPSLMPVLGGLIGAAGIAVLPFDRSLLWAGLPIALDSIAVLLSTSLQGRRRRAK